MVQEDKILIAELELMYEPVQNCLAHYENQKKLGLPFTRPSPDIHDLAKPIIAVLESHPKFKNALTRFFGPKQLMLHSQWQAVNLLKVMAAKNAKDAVAWLYKIFSIEVASIRFVAEVHGLQTNQRHELKNGVALMPLNQLPPSANAEGLAIQYKSIPLPSTRPTHAPIGATFEVPNVRFSTSYEESVSSQKLDSRSAELERTIRAFTLKDKAAPVIGVSWFEFTDPDLAMAETGRMWMTPIFEGVLRRAFPVEIDSDALFWIDKYLLLGSNIRDVCDIAIDRLNLARRRMFPGDKSIEGSICLEALLGDEDGTELTYKLSLRAALLLGENLEQRREIRKLVKEFYRLRSKIVHGRISKNSYNDTACADRGLEMCAQALRKIVVLNRKFTNEDWRDWELTGGDPLFSSNNMPV